ncbi:MAG TPA: nitroreductase family protein [Candidatus Hydrogenedentes bacterium]|nr:nitroreductase family protein [Candidatus Hydrogenedentota bacterium]HPG68014.1 nitroreductase family protein [Candidatus Hydrogenedentota bacterium]
MMDVMEVIRARRSVRAYAAKPVDPETVDLLLDAVRWAQSWANTQCWEVVVVRDQSIRLALQATAPAGNPSHHAIAQAPIVLALCAKLGAAGFYKGNAATKFGDWFMFDLGVAAQNIALAAQAHGLGSVIVGLFDHDEARAALKVPEGYEVVALMPIGYPDGAVAPPPRKDVTEFVHENTF